MKVNVDCNNCEITIEEVDGKCIVTAIQGGEVVEEFTVDCEVESDDSEELPEEIEGGEEIEGEEIEDTEDLLDDEEVSESVKTFTEFYVKKKK
jgi:hypothetical protein